MLRKNMQYKRILCCGESELKLHTARAHAPLVE